MTTVTLKAPAKINLWLDIASKRPDGYHDIESVMQTVTLFDELTIERLEPQSRIRRITVSIRLPVTRATSATGLRRNSSVRSGSAAMASRFILKSGSR